jgi:hypothetical protein
MLQYSLDIKNVVDGYLKHIGITKGHSRENLLRDWLDSGWLKGYSENNQQAIKESCRELSQPKRFPRGLYNRGIFQNAM